MPERDGVYPIVTWRPASGVAGGAAHVARKPLTRKEAHERLGHIAHSTVEALARSGAVVGFEVDLSTPIVQCEACILAKAKNKPIAKKHVDPRASAPGEHVSADLDAHTDVAWLSLQRTKKAAETRPREGVPGRRLRAAPRRQGIEARADGA